MGWNGSANDGEGVARAPRSVKRPARWRGLVAATVVVAGALVAFIALQRGDGRGDGDETASRPSRIAVPKGSRPKPSRQINVRREVVKTGDRLQDALEEVAAAGELVQIQGSKMSPERREASRRAFKTGVEQLMSWVFTVEVGDMPMPIPSISDEDRAKLAEILISKNEIDENDDERLADAKETVDYAKGEMAKFIKQGGDPDEFLQYYFQQLNNAFQLRNEAQSQCEELAEEDPDLAREFVKRVNERFDLQGIKRISVPDEVDFEAEGQEQEEAE